MNKKLEPVVVLDITSEERREAEKRFEVARGVARKKYNTATYEVWKEYESEWRPLRESWDAFQRPHFLTMQEEISAASKQRDEELSFAGSKRPPIVHGKDKEPLVGGTQ